MAGEGGELPEVTRNRSLVVVSDVHVKQGEPLEAGSCPVALSLREALADPAASIAVGAQYVAVSQRHDQWWAETPDEMSDFISRFDSTADDGDDRGRQSLIDAASAGLLQWELCWHEGPAPDCEDDD